MALNVCSRILQSMQVSDWKPVENRRDVIGGWSPDDVDSNILDQLELMDELMGGGGCD